MTATDELRAMLDERGVEWMPSVWSAKDETFYKIGEIGYLATELSSGRMKVCIEGYPTPAQAVEVTLGRGECHMVPTRDKPRSKAPTLTCSECGWWTDRIGESVNYCPNCGRRYVG